jgi:hypothetical protein
MIWVNEWMKSWMMNWWVNRCQSISRKKKKSSSIKQGGCCALWRADCSLVSCLKTSNQVLGNSKKRNFLNILVRSYSSLHIIYVCVVLYRLQNTCMLATPPPPCTSVKPSASSMPSTEAHLGRQEHQQWCWLGRVLFEFITVTLVLLLSLDTENQRGLCMATQPTPEPGSGSHISDDLSWERAWGMGWHWQHRMGIHRRMNEMTSVSQSVRWIQPVDPG